MMDYLKNSDPEVWEAIRRELLRQQNTLELIASENFCSPGVMAAQGSVLTNKYAEGYPDHRWYGGCAAIDIVEQLAVDRAKELFGAEHANVQPHSGSQANMAAYFALLEPGETLMAMDIAHGGHLTHGTRANFSGRLYNVVPYGVDRRTETIDYDEVARTARESRPRVIVVGASSYPRTLAFDRFREIADEVEAYLVVDMAHIAGLVAAGEHPSPVPVADVVTSTSHKTLRGPRGGFVLCRRRYACDIDREVFPGVQGGPLEHVIAAKAVCFKEAAGDDFKAYQKQVKRNAARLADQMAGLGYRIVAGGTDTHLLLVDLSDHHITGRQACDVLERAGIAVNKNLIPFDASPPSKTSGIRLGSPSLTTRGMKEPEMDEVARLIDAVLRARGEEKAVRAVGAKVRQMCEAFPLYRELD